MTLVNDCVCGLCNAGGTSINQTPATFPRILRALDLNKLPPLLTDADNRERIGLCVECESKVQMLEEAVCVRENLKESFINNLKKLSGAYNSNPGIPFEYQQQQHSIRTNGLIHHPYSESVHSKKRKISSGALDSFGSARRKQLKTTINHTLPISPASNTTEAVSSSDDENALQIDEMSLPSPCSSDVSRQSVSPSFASDRKGNSSSQALSDNSQSKNRRKQARPSKAATHTSEPGQASPVPASTSETVPSATQGCILTESEEVSSEHRSAAGAPEASKESQSSRRELDRTNALPMNVSMSTSLPLIFSSYQNNGSTNVFAPLGLTNADSIVNSNMLRCMRVLPNEVNTMAKNLAADIHTLLKTDKRRYCKVCAAAARKANNGRPPQSRFLCSVCNIPMCRSCIEEHRVKIRNKMDDSSPYSTSASARLLQAIKLKEEASPHSHPSGSPPSAAVSPNSQQFGTDLRVEGRKSPLPAADHKTSNIPHTSVNGSLSRAHLKPIAPAPSKISISVTTPGSVEPFHLPMLSSTPSSKTSSEQTISLPAAASPLQPLQSSLNIPNLALEQLNDRTANLIKIANSRLLAVAKCDDLPCNEMSRLASSAYLPSEHIPEQTALDSPLMDKTAIPLKQQLSV